MDPSQPPPTDAPPGKEQKLLRNARREGLLIMLVWLATLVWSVGAGYYLGYNLKPEEIRLILGMPAWVFWSVVLPWIVCLVFSVWFCFFYMADDDLGQDPDEGEGHG
jgi:hypothetical protein